MVTDIDYKLQLLSNFLPHQFNVCFTPLPDTYLVRNRQWPME